MITIDGIDDVITDLMVVASTLPNRKENLLNQLADIGEREMQGLYTPQGVYDFNDTVVSKHVSTKGAEVSASGSKVTFIEYGAGDKTTNPAGMGFTGANYVAGDWSMTHTQEYFKYRSWHFHKIEYKFQPSERYAFNAYKEMMDAIPSIGKDFFKV